MADILLGGIGGQGVLTAGKILTEIGAATVKNVCWTSEYSAEMRGGFALSRVVISDDDIGSPYPDQLDVLLCMDINTFKNFSHQLRPDGYAIVNTAVFADYKFPEGMKVVGVDATALAAEANNHRSANLVMMGAMIKATGMIDHNKFGETLTAYFESKGKGAQSNLMCYELGYNHATTI